MGGPSVSATVTGAPQNLGIWVDSPNGKDATNIRMGYPADGNFQFSTGWKAKLGSQSYQKEYYCDDVSTTDANAPAAWKNYNLNGRNGFQREVNCHFRGWGNNYGDIL